VELIDAVRGRRSSGRLAEPAPTDEDICDLLADAATGPDHGLLRPWRLVLVRDTARQTLGSAIVADLSEPDDSARSRAAAKPLRAPLLLSIVFSPVDNPKVPEWEQLAATTAVVHTLTLLLHERGWGAMWRTGVPCRAEPVRQLLGVRPGETLLGWLYVGTPQPVRPVPRPPFDPRVRLAVLDQDGTLRPLPSAVPAP
jgi:nitroreductase